MEVVERERTLVVRQPWIESTSAGLPGRMRDLVKRAPAL